MASGPDLITALKHHVIETMRRLPDCAPNGDGAGNREIEEASGLALELDSQDGYLTWSVLQALVREGIVEVIPDRRGRRRYRFA